MKAISATLGVARSNVIERRYGLRARRGPQERPGDVELAGVIRRFVDERPTYGYRRIAALLKRERRSDGLAPVNTKRGYRLMKKHRLLLERHTGRRQPREHDGRVATIQSNDAHNPGDLGFMRCEVEQARCGWLEPSDILNTRSLDGLRAALRRL